MELNSSILENGNQGLFFKAWYELGLAGLKLYDSELRNLGFKVEFEVE